MTGSELSAACRAQSAGREPVPKEIELKLEIAPKGAKALLAANLFGEACGEEALHVAEQRLRLLLADVGACLREVAGKPIEDADEASQEVLGSEPVPYRALDRRPYRCLREQHDVIEEGPDLRLHIDLEPDAEGPVVPGRDAAQFERGPGGCTRPLRPAGVRGAGYGEQARTGRWRSGRSRGGTTASIE